MFYFGLNSEGLIHSHTFDRKISNMKPDVMSVSSYPWIRSNQGANWTPDLVGAAYATPSTENKID